MNLAQFKIKVGDRVVTDMGVKGVCARVYKDYLYFIKVEGREELYTVMKPNVRKELKHE